MGKLPNPVRRWSLTRARGTEGGRGRKPLDEKAWGGSCNALWGCRVGKKKEPVYRGEERREGQPSLMSQGVVPAMWGSMRFKGERPRGEK